MSISPRGVSMSCTLCGADTAPKSAGQIAFNGTGHWFCSKAHYWEWRRDHPVTSERQKAAASDTMRRLWSNPEWRKKQAAGRRPRQKRQRGTPRPQKVEVQCVVCGTPKMVHPCRERTRGHFFCSKSCRSQPGPWRRMGIRHPGYSRAVVSCANCGKELLVIRFKRETNKHHFCSHGGCYAEWLAKRPREQHPRYRGGDETVREAWERNGGRKWKRDCRRRDGWQCGLCRRQYAKYSDCPPVHHQASFSAYAELRSELDNGITLCRDCHRIVHMRVGIPLRDWWEAELLAKHLCKAVVY